MFNIFSYHCHLCCPLLSVKVSDLFKKLVYLFLSDNPTLAKSLFRVHRNKVISNVINRDFNFPLKYDTVVHLLNRVEVKDKRLAEIEPLPLKKELDNLFGVIN